MQGNLKLHQIEFLGLVNYCGRFIPDLGTISEPLSCLTKAGTLFVFGKEQKVAFEELKKYLSSAETLTRKF